VWVGVEEIDGGDVEWVGGGELDGGGVGDVGEFGGLVPVSDGLDEGLFGGELLTVVGPVFVLPLSVSDSARFEVVDVDDDGAEVIGDDNDEMVSPASMTLKKLSRLYCCTYAF